MLTETALAYFDGSPTKLAKAIGLTRGAINQWGPVVPLASATVLERVTKRKKRKLRIDHSLYDGTRTIYPSLRILRWRERVSA
jgi:hypothetical protein